MTAKKRPPASTPPHESAPSATEAARFLNRKEVAAALKLHVRTLDQLVSSGGYPPPDLHFGRSPRWSVRTHNRWAEMQER